MKLIHVQNPLLWGAWENLIRIIPEEPAMLNKQATVLVNNTEKSYSLYSVTVCNV